MKKNNTGNAIKHPRNAIKHPRNAIKHPRNAIKHPMELSVEDAASKWPNKFKPSTIRQYCKLGLIRYRVEERKVWSPLHQRTFLRRKIWINENDFKQFIDSYLKLPQKFMKKTRPPKVIR